MSENVAAAEQPQAQQDTNAPDAAPEAQPTADAAPAEGAKEQQPQAEQRPEWLKPKYKSVEDQAKAYAELEKKLGETVPEAYDFDGLFKEHTNLGWESDAQRDQVQKSFKDLRLTNSQVAGVLKMYSERVNQFAAMSGTPVDVAKENDALRREWGDDFQPRMQALQQFAEKTLPKDVVDRPLAATAAGIKVLHELMQSRMGPELIKSGGLLSGSDARDRMRRIQEDPAYWSTTPTGKRLQEEYLELAKRAGSRD